MATRFPMSGPFMDQSPDSLLDRLVAEEDNEELKNDTSLFNIRRLLFKLKYYTSIATSIPSKIKFLLQKFFQICSSSEEFFKFCQEVWETIWKLPIVTFYSYLWKVDKFHFCFNLFVGYGLPILLEALPWFFSRRKIGKELRDVRNKIHNTMIQTKPFEFSTAKRYIIFTLMFSFLETLDRHLKTRVSIMDKFLIKRLVLERVLYSELGSLDHYQLSELEYRIINDISTTLHFFNFTVPTIFSNFYAIASDSVDLFHKRHQIDALAIARPFASSLIWKVFDWIRMEVLGRNVGAYYQLANPEVQNLFNTVLEGIVDVQLNNLQTQQLRQYDAILAKEFNFVESVRFFLLRIYSGFTNRGVFDFLSDAYVATRVMARRKLNFEQYRKIQLDINHLYNLVKRTGHYLQISKRVVERQHRVVELLSMPNFMDEDKKLPIQVEQFEQLLIQNIQFSYSETAGNALQLEGSILFIPNKTYAIIGQNRSGKSTLVNLICKLYAPKSGCLEWNGIPYSLIQRNSLRNLISYVSQKPFIFPGTIRENILIGNSNASEEEIMQAAENAGVFLYEDYLQKLNSTKQQSKQTLQEPLIQVYLNELISTNQIELHLVDTTKGKSFVKQTQYRLANYRIAVPFVVEDSSIKVDLIERIPFAAGGVDISNKVRVLNSPTMIRGTNLSGGFAQSIALARVFLKTKAQVVILDESMSAMDPIKKNNVILPNIFSFVKKHGMTLIMISHDMACLDMVDHVVLLEMGRLVCQGSHQELVAKRVPKYLEMLGKEAQGEELG